MPSNYDSHLAAGRVVIQSFVRRVLYATPSGLFTVESREIEHQTEPEASVLRTDVTSF